MDGKLIFQRDGVKGAFALPGGLFLPGKDYQWQALQEGHAVKGVFHTLESPAASELQQELGAIERDPALETDEKKALSAMAFDRAGLAFDRDRIMADVVGQRRARQN